MKYAHWGTCLLMIAIIVLLASCKPAQVVEELPEMNKGENISVVADSSFQNAITESQEDSKNYTYDQFAAFFKNDTSVVSIIARFGLVEACSYVSPEYGESHYYVYPLKNNEYCFVFFDPQPYTGQGDMVLELMKYPSERFDQLGCFLVRQEDIPFNQAN